MSTSKSVTEGNKNKKADDKELKTDTPLSEKDEVKAAERKQRKAAEEKPTTDKK